MPKANMSKTNMKNASKRVKAEKIFTDREEPRKVFWRAYQELEEDIENYKVLNYYGIGGIGKTRLIEKLIEEMNEKEKAFVSLNFEYTNSQDKVLILRELGAKLFRLDKKRFKFYRFRFAMERYAEETEQEIKIKNDNSSFLTNNPLIELGKETSDTVLEIVDNLPIISAISQAIGLLDRGRELIKNKIDTKKMKKSLIEIQTWEVSKILEHIEEYFYEDLAEAMLDAKEPLVIFLDTYEKFANSFENNDYQIYESWLKSIVSEPQGILWVIAGREHLKWEEAFEVEDHLIENLAFNDAKQFLITAGVEENLTEKIYELTDGNPVFLDVCVDRNEKLINEGKTPTIDDFGESREKIIERYIRYMDKNEKRMAYFLAYIEKWDAEKLEELKQNPNIAKIIWDDYDRFIEHSFIIKDGKELYITKIVQEVWYENISKALRKEFHEAYKEFLEKKVKENARNINVVDYLILLVDEYIRGEILPTDENYKKLEELLECICDLYDIGQMNDEHSLINKLMKFFLSKNEKYELFKIEVQHYLAISYRDKGDFQKSLEISQELYEKRKKILGEKHPDTLKAFNNMAVSYSKLGEYQKALEIEEEVYEKEKEVLGESHQDTLKTLSNIAVSYSNIGNHAKVLEINEQVYQKRKETLGENHLDTLKALSNMAASYSYMGDYAKALEVNEQVYQKRKETLGENHLDTLKVLNNMAVSNSCIKEHQKALELYCQVYEKRKKMLGENHPDTLKVLSNLANSYAAMGNHVKALEINEQVYSKRKEILGENHPDTLTTLGNIAVSYSNMKDYEKALELYQQVYEKRKEMLGENNPSTLTTLGNMADLYSHMGDNLKALEIKKQVYEKRKEVLGESHPYTKIALNNLANAYEDIGEHQKAVELLFL